jgi:hypothetical protein
MVSVDDKDISCYVTLITVSLNALHKEKSGTLREKEMKRRELHSYQDKMNNRSTLPVLSRGVYVRLNL